jgi:hypothetical protein
LGWRRGNVKGQISLFDIGFLGREKKRRKYVREYSWKDYGISRERKNELKDMCQREEYARVVLYAAHRANEELEGYIYLSMTKKLSFDQMGASQYVEKYGVPMYCRTDFYGYRRLAYHYFDEKVKEMNQKQK